VHFLAGEFSRRAVFEVFDGLNNTAQSAGKLLSKHESGSEPSPIDATVS